MVFYMDQLCNTIQQNCHKSTDNIVVPAKLLADNVISHSISEADFNTLYNIYYAMSNNKDTMLVTKYYDQDQVLHVTANDMKCYISFRNYQIYSPEHGLEFSRNKVINVSTTKFETLDKIHHKRQCLVTTMSTDDYRIDFEVLYTDVHKIRHEVDILHLGNNILSRSYVFYFKKPLISLIKKHINILNGKSLCAK